MKVEELIAREQIRDVLVRYARSVDRNDLSMVRAVFWDDAWVQFPESLHQGSLDGFLEFAKNEFPRFHRTRHSLSNTVIDFDGSKTAYVDTYLHADHQGTESHHWKTRVIELWARYLDRFEERNGAWKIARRELIVDWMYKYPIEGWFDDHPDASDTRRNGTDAFVKPRAGFEGKSAGG
jgi:ketosteroid isomerase-like protein